MLTIIKTLYQQGVFSEFDLHFSQFIYRLANKKSDELLLAATLTSYFTNQGHICIDLEEQANQPFPLVSTDNNIQIHCPDLTTWLAALKNSGVVGQSGDYTPLILNNTSLYLYRYWQYEVQLSQNIQQRLTYKPNDIDEKKLATVLQNLFPNDNDQMAGQKNAARTAVFNNFCVISGGPGTGKTYTVVQILALLLAQNPHLRIALTAPTGKASARLKETIVRNKQNLNLQVAIPEETYTIHRLLGSIPNSPYFFHNEHNPLPYDVVVVDEASMVDLALITKLAQAIPMTSRWILLGDKDQLASVEAGTVFGDICQVDTTHLQTSMAFLDQNYRFNDESGISALVQAVKQGDTTETLSILQTQQYDNLRWLPTHQHEQLLSVLTDYVFEQLASYLRILKTASPIELLQLFEQVRILCVLRRGRYGVENINRLIEQILAERHYIKTSYRWYHGKPIMITRNDYTLKLFNGDIGIILWNEQQELQAYFPDSEGGVRSFYPHRLPEHETVYAMTIHKSQGSEFERVFMILPDQDNAILSRELIYTGMTRAKSALTILGNDDVIKQAITRKIRRTSGLQEALQV